MNNVIAAFISLLFAANPFTLTPQTFGAMWSQAQSQVSAAASPSPSPSPTPIVSPVYRQATAAPSPAATDDDTQPEPAGGDGDGKTAAPIASPSASPASVSQTSAPSSSAPQTAAPQTAAPVAQPTAWTWPSSTPLPSATASAPPDRLPPTKNSSLPCDMQTSITNGASWSALCQFDANGPWHQVLYGITSADYDPQSDAKIANELQYGSPGLRYADEYPNVVCNRATAAQCVQVRIACDQYCGGPSVNGMTMYIPSNARSQGLGRSGYSDLHESVLDCLSGPCREWNFWGAHSFPPFSNGSAFGAWAAGYRDPINGDGWSDLHGGPADVSGASLLASQIRVSELAAGIQHAIQIAPACGTGKVYPAQMALSQQCSRGNTSMTPAAGQRLWWDDDCQAIKGYGYGNTVTKVLCAAHTFGFYVTDTNGGAYSFNIADIEDYHEATALGYADFVGSFMSTSGNDFGNLSNSFVRHHLHVLKPCVNLTGQSC